MFTARQFCGQMGAVCEVSASAALLVLLLSSNTQRAEVNPSVKNNNFNF